METTYHRIKRENINLKCERDELKKRVQDTLDDLSKVSEGCMRAENVLLLSVFCIILESVVIAYLLYILIN